MQTQDPGYIFGPAFIPNCTAVRLIWRLPNQKVANNVLHGSGSAPLTTQTQINSLYTAIAAGFTSSGLAAACNTEFALESVGSRNMADAGGGVGFGEIVSNLSSTPGTGSGDPLPANVSFVVSLKTGHAGQANRGRVYLTGFDETSNDTQGLATDALKNACTAFLGTVSTAFTAAGLTLCIAHPARKAYTSGATGRPIPARSAGTVTVVSIAALNNVFDSQRLRSLR